MAERQLARTGMSNTLEQAINADDGDRAAKIIQDACAHCKAKEHLIRDAEDAMETAAGGFAALGEAVVFLIHFKDLPDPRQPGKVTYPLGRGDRH
jgi:hypothetical protein